MRRNLVITVAIVMALGLMIPTSVILLNYHPQSNLPPIYATDGSHAANWSYGFSNASSGDPPLFDGGYSNATFWQSGWANSSLITGLRTSGFDDASYGGLLFTFAINVSGSLHLSHLPSNVVISYKPSTEGSFGITSRILNQTGFYSYIEPTNVSATGGFNPLNYSVELLNESSYNGTGSYDFAFTGFTSLELYPPGMNVPFGVSINVSLSGLSRPVYANILLKLTDRGTNTSVTMSALALSYSVHSLSVEHGNYTMYDFYVTANHNYVVWSNLMQDRLP